MKTMQNVFGKMNDFELFTISWIIVVPALVVLMNVLGASYRSCSIVMMLCIGWGVFTGVRTYRRTKEMEKESKRTARRERYYKR